MNDFVVTLDKFRKEISCSTKQDVYLYGNTLRKILTSKQLPDVVDLLILESDKSIQSVILSKSPSIFNIRFASHVSYNAECYTFDNIHAKVPFIMKEQLEVESTNNGILDLNKGIIKLTKYGKTKVIDSPEFILDTIYTASESSFYLDSATISLFAQNKDKISKVEPRKIFWFFVNILKNEKPRKTISLLNALGISKELFDNKLYETSVVNHLNQKDIFEFFALIFTNIDKSRLNDILHKCGFTDKDIEPIKSIMTAIEFIDDETDVVARKILRVIPKSRIQNVIRLIRFLGFKALTKHLRVQKDNMPKIKVGVDLNLLKNVFKVDDYEARLMLDKAKEWITVDPDNNEKDKILIFLNKERG